ncbi:hypothetical protein [Saccharomonospora piscinae]|uniref:hypothetical protein n=1 Tax=Saccharomonospora piscinae TaxID=687388 RepID=UPI000464AB06|nr:hypothetical protein [Saccharomonospora piscinae]
MSDKHDEPTGVWCNACNGDGRIPDPKLAITSGAPQTMVSSRECRWCKGTGRRPGFHPPV